MLDKYKQGVTYGSEQKEASSTLVQYVAMAVKSCPSYTLKKNTDGTYTKTPGDGTGADAHDIVSGLKDNLNLDVIPYYNGKNSTAWRNLGGLASEDWDFIVAKIKENVAAEKEDDRLPVLISGHRAKWNAQKKVWERAGGHIFVCHGYYEQSDGTKWLYINWGYGGSSYDGWFKSGLLNYKYDTNTSSEGYNVSRHVYLNIKPRYNKYNVDHVLLVKILQNIGVTNTSKTKELYRELNFDYDNTITDGDAETLARFMLRDKDITKAEDHKSIELSALVDIRKSLREINDKLSQLSN
jgi:hypothetical protein